MNTSATINAFRLIYNPALCLPQATISNFNKLPLPLSSAFVSVPNRQKLDIRAVVLDKDNCFAKPRENNVYQPYNVCGQFHEGQAFWYRWKEKFQALRGAYPGSGLLIVSNSAGTNDDVEGKEARLLEVATGVKVLRHSTKKPGCGPQIMEYFRNHAADANVTSPNQIAVVGDRLATDVMMANMIGFWSVWIKDGVVNQNKLVSLWSWHKLCYIRNWLISSSRDGSFACQVICCAEALSPRNPRSNCCRILTRHCSTEAANLSEYRCMATYTYIFRPACPEAPRSGGFPLIYDLYQIVG